MKNKVLVDGIISRELLYFAAGETLGDGFGLGDFDADIAEILHFLPISHRILLNFI